MVYNNTEQMTSGELVKVSFDLYVTWSATDPSITWSGRKEARLGTESYAEWEYRPWWLWPLWLHIPGPDLLLLDQLSRACQAGSGVL